MLTIEELNGSLKCPVCKKTLEIFINKNLTTAGYRRFECPPNTKETEMFHYVLIHRNMGERNSYEEQLYLPPFSIEYYYNVNSGNFSGYIVKDTVDALFTTEELPHFQTIEEIQNFLLIS